MLAGPTGELMGVRRLDRGGFAAFYQANIRKLLVYFIRRVHDPQVAADLAAETFVDALERIDSYDPTRGNPEQWLYGIARNQLAAFWRHLDVETRARDRYGIPHEELDQAAADALSAVDSEFVGTPVLDALAQITPALRTAVSMRVIDGLPYEVIARRLGCTVGAARTRVSRGLDALEKLL